MKIISSEQTPNPNAIKFILDGKILDDGSRQFDSASKVGEDLIALALFKVKSVKSVYYRDDFITVENKDPLEWDRIRTVIEKTVEELESVKSGSDKSEKSDNKLLLRIESLLDERVRPFLANDGGGLDVLGLDGKNLMIRYEGACGGCPHAIMGTLHSIQNLLREEIDSELNVIPA